MTGQLEPDKFLGRVLRSEVDVSSLLAYCASLDPVPLQQLLQLSEPITGVAVEVQHGKSSRLDVVLHHGAAEPQAVLELKVSATEHGDQLTRYDEYAREHRARKFLVDLELAGTHVPDGWTRLNLVDVFDCWGQSSNPAAQALAKAISNVFGKWTEQTRGTFQDIDPAILSAVIRSVAGTLTLGGIETSAFTTSGGRPGLIALAPHPSGLTDASLCIVVRQDQADQNRLWTLRAGVHVREGEGDPPRTTAHRLMTEVSPELTLSGVRSGFDPDQADLASKISGNRPVKVPKHRDEKIEHWLKVSPGTESGPLPPHPLYYHDFRGRRLNALFSLDVPTMVADDLASIIRVTMAHLIRAATARASTAHEGDQSGPRRPE